MACAKERCMVRACDLRFPAALAELTAPKPRQTLAYRVPGQMTPQSWPEGNLLLGDDAGGCGGRAVGDLHRCAATADLGVKEGRPDRAQDTRTTTRVRG